jgi:UDP-glucose 4-epimerase
MKILLTGGAGYIGSHVLLCCLEAGHDVEVLDNFHNSSPEALARVEVLARRQVKLQRGDVRDYDFLRHVLSGSGFDAVMHFAGLKAVGESVTRPLDYYDVNVAGSLTLTRAMVDAGVFRLVFSSTASVYGDQAEMPLTEVCSSAQAASPYGRSKRMVEITLEDLAASDARWCMGILRYFNPVGAHSSGQIGEDPRGEPTNLIPFAMQVAIGRREELSVFGSDYPTPDGTGMRDYIHVMDLAEGHLAALDFLHKQQGYHVWNLGTGSPHSVLDIVRGIEQVTGKPLPSRPAARREGDVARCWADPSRATEQLGWRASRGLYQMLADHWRWQQLQPSGYPSQADLDEG